MNLTEEKMKLVGIYNVLQERINEYWMVDIAIDSWPFKKLCADKQAIEQKIKDINKLLNIKDE